MKTIVSIIIFIFIGNELSLVQTLKNDSHAINGLEKDNSTICISANCIMKCCPLEKYFMVINKNRTCAYFNSTARNFENLVKEVFVNYPDISKLNLSVKAGILEENETFKLEAVNIANSDHINLHLSESSEVYLEFPNAYYRWTRIPNDRFCWDYKIRRTKQGKTLVPGVWAVFPEEPVEHHHMGRIAAILLTVVLLVSCIFLLAVLVVYAVLQELRNLSGQILVAYVGSLFVAFLLLATMRIQLHAELTCRVLTFLIYYFFLATFCWMNVMSYDIWQSFRRSATVRVSHWRCKSFKFLVYCLYAFGLPLAMTIALFVLNTINMRHIPWFVTPNLHHGCFITGGEKFLYFYVPMLIFMLCNWIFYLMTAVNVSRMSREAVVLDSTAGRTSQAHRSHRNRLLVYLKLSVVMGLSWVFEVISFLHPGHSAWLVTDFFNMSIGVTLFFVFVCNRKILRKLLQRWRPVQSPVESTSSLSIVEEKELEVSLKSNDLENDRIPN